MLILYFVCKYTRIMQRWNIMQFCLIDKEMNIERDWPRLHLMGPPRHGHHSRWAQLTEIPSKSRSTWTMRRILSANPGKAFVHMHHHPRMYYGNGEWVPDSIMRISILRWDLDSGQRHSREPCYSCTIVINWSDFCEARWSASNLSLVSQQSCMWCKAMRDRRKGLDGDNMDRQTYSDCFFCVLYIVNA